MNLTKNVELKRLVDDLLKILFTTCIATTLFVPKIDVAWHMCMDGRASLKSPLSIGFLYIVWRIC